MPTFNLSKKQKDILRRSSIPRTASNYSDAVDGDISKIRDVFTQIADDYTESYKKYPILSTIMSPLPISVAYQKFGKVPTRMSNCTLTATQWVNPKQPIMRAATIINNGEQYGYREIPEEHILPGDLVIVTNPNNNTHHTMLISGFTDKEQKHRFMGKDYILPPDHPLVRYSDGSTHPSGYRKSVGLLEYLDNSEGKTNVRYYRHYDPGEKEVLLPEIEVNPRKSH